MSSHPNIVVKKFTIRMLINYPRLSHLSSITDVSTNLKFSRKQLTMIRQIMEGRYSFSSSEWNDISQEPRDLIAKMLVVDDKQRLTVAQCLCHEFLAPRKMSRRGSVITTDTASAADTNTLPAPELVNFNSRQLWRLAHHAIRFIVRLRRLKDTPEPLCLHTAATNPYKMRMVRKVLDAAAFNVYSHWIKRAEGQNRAAMFELVPKRDLPNQAQEKFISFSEYQKLRNDK